MLVVSNTSPISNLAIVGRLEFLRRRYALVRIPPPVADELAALTHLVRKRMAHDRRLQKFLKNSLEKIPETTMITIDREHGQQWRKNLIFGKLATDFNPAMFVLKNKVLEP